MDENKAKAFVLGGMAMDRASADPFPGPLLNAFCTDAIDAGGQKVRKVVASDWALLQSLNSPIIKMIEELKQDQNKEPEIPITAEEKFEICYQFTHNPKENRALLKQGKDSFREAATDFADFNLNQLQVDEILKAVILQIQRSWETALKYQADTREKEKTVFTQATPQTA